MRRCEHFSTFFFSIFSISRIDSVINFCRGLNDINLENDLDALALYFENGIHHMNYQKVVALFRDEEYSQFGQRQTMYMGCTQISQFRTSRLLPPPINDKFGIDFWVNLCQDIFGPDFNEEFIRNGNLNTNLVFGGLTPQVTNVYFTNGGIDPARLLSVTEDLNESSPADVIPGHGNGFDLRPLSLSDSPELLAVKSRAWKLIMEWIQ